MWHVLYLQLLQYSCDAPSNLTLVRSHPSTVNVPVAGYGDVNVAIDIVEYR